MPFLRRILQRLIQSLQAFYHWLNDQPAREEELSAAKTAAGQDQSLDDRGAPETPLVLDEPDLGLATDEPPRYAKRRSLLTNPESELFHKLLNEVGEEYRVFSKVRLGDVIYLQNQPQDRKFHNNQIQCKHFDFVLCHVTSHEPLLAIELNDDSHYRSARMRSDKFKQTVCEQIGLPILWLAVGTKYPPGDLARQIRAKIGPTVRPTLSQ